MSTGGLARDGFKGQVVMLGALIVYAVIMSIGCSFWLYRRVRPVQRRSYAIATIANNLGPLLRRHVKSGTEIWVVGGDGGPVARPRYSWRPLVEQCLAKAITIHYLLAAPTRQALLELEALRARYGDRLRVRVLDGEKLKDAGGDDQQTFSQLNTFHFLLAKNPELMWIEREHLPGTVEAKDCEFIGPSLAGSDPRYEILKGVFDRAWSDFSTEPSARDQAA